MSAAVLTISRLLARSGEGRAFFASSGDAVPCGIPEIDRLIKGGFPRGGMTEILTAQQGCGELRLILGAAARLGRACWILSDSAAFEPYAPAMAQAGIDIGKQLFAVPATPEEAFWCAEHAAASGETDAVIAWLPPLTREKDFAAMRRLHLAAERTGTTIFAFRPYGMCCVSSPAELRLQLMPDRRSDAVTVRAVRRGSLFSQSASARIDTAVLTGTAVRTAAAKPFQPELSFELAEPEPA